MGWRLSLAAVLLVLIWPALALKKQAEVDWDSKLALAELEGKPVLAFSPWDRWRAALGGSAMEFAYARTATPGGSQDWVLAPTTDAKLTTLGREGYYQISLFSASGKLYYSMSAFYTRPDGMRYRQGYLWGRAFPPGSKQPDCSSEASGAVNNYSWWTDSAVLDGMPLIAYVETTYQAKGNRASLHAASGNNAAMELSGKWHRSEIDAADGIDSVALAIDGGRILACYSAQRSTAAGRSGLVLQEGRLQPDGALSWRVLRVLRPGRPASVSRLLVGGGQVYLVCDTEAGLILARCPVDQLETKASWEISGIQRGPYLLTMDAVILDGLPAVLYKDSAADCHLALAKSPHPVVPQDWSCIRFATGINADSMWNVFGTTLSAMHVLDGKLAIAYQCGAPRGIAYAWTDLPQPRQAADWHNSIVFREADFKGVTAPAYSTFSVDDGQARLAPPMDEPVPATAGPAPHTWRAQAPAPFGSAANRNIYWLLAAALAILFCAGIAAYLLRRMLRRIKQS